MTKLQALAARLLGRANSTRDEELQADLFEAAQYLKRFDALQQANGREGTPKDVPAELAKLIYPQG